MLFGIGCIDKDHHQTDQSWLYWFGFSLYLIGVGIDIGVMYVFPRRKIFHGLLVAPARGLKTVPVERMPKDSQMASLNDYFPGPTRGCMNSIMTEYDHRA